MTHQALPWQDETAGSQLQMSLILEGLSNALTGELLIACGMRKGGSNRNATLLDGHTCSCAIQATVCWTDDLLCRGGILEGCSAHCLCPGPVQHGPHLHGSGHHAHGQRVWLGTRSASRSVSDHPFVVRHTVLVIRDHESAMLYANAWQWLGLHPATRFNLKAYRIVSCAYLMLSELQNCKSHLAKGIWTGQALSIPCNWSWFLP